MAKGILVSNGLIWKQQRHFGIGTLRKLGMGNKGMERGIQTEARFLVEFFRDKEGMALTQCLGQTQHSLLDSKGTFVTEENGFGAHLRFADLGKVLKNCRPHILWCLLTDWKKKHEAIQQGNP